MLREGLPFAPSVLMGVGAAALRQAQDAPALTARKFAPGDFAGTNGGHLRPPDNAFSSQMSVVSRQTRYYEKTYWISLDIRIVMVLNFLTYPPVRHSPTT